MHPKSLLLAAAALLLSSAHAQEPKGGKKAGGPPGGGNPAGREAAALAEPFVGITTDGKVQPGLFAIKSTGVTTAPVQKAAAAFLAALGEDQRKKTMFPVDDIEWRKWMNVHRYTRQGVSFQEMSEPQREAAFGLMRASLSAKPPSG